MGTLYKPNSSPGDFQGQSLQGQFDPAAQNWADYKNGNNVTRGAPGAVDRLSTPPTGGPGESVANTMGPETGGNTAVNNIAVSGGTDPATGGPASGLVSKPRDTGMSTGGMNNAPILDDVLGNQAKYKGTSFDPSLNVWGNPTISGYQPWAQNGGQGGQGPGVGGGSANSGPAGQMFNPQPTFNNPSQFQGAFSGGNGQYLQMMSPEDKQAIYSGEANIPQLLQKYGLTWDPKTQRMMKASDWLNTNNPNVQVNQQTGMTYNTPGLGQVDPNATFGTNKAGGTFENNLYNLPSGTYYANRNGGPASGALFKKPEDKLTETPVDPGSGNNTGYTGAWKDPKAWTPYNFQQNPLGQNADHGMLDSVAQGWGADQKNALASMMTNPNMSNNPMAQYLAQKMGIGASPLTTNSLSSGSGLRPGMTAGNQTQDTTASTGTGSTASTGATNALSSNTLTPDRLKGLGLDENTYNTYGGSPGSYQMWLQMQLQNRGLA